jgi:hypothetical protein
MRKRQQHLERIVASATVEHIIAFAPFVDVQASEIGRWREDETTMR